MEVRTVVLGPICLIGKEGFCTKENNVVSQLWQDFQQNYSDVADIAMKEKDGSIVGFWGAMSDESKTYQPWTNGFSTGFYLAAVEVYPGNIIPEGWLQWTLPENTYLVVEVNPDTYGKTFNEMIQHYIPENGYVLCNAVQDHCKPATGQNYLFFPVQKI